MSYTWILVQATPDDALCHLSHKRGLHPSIFPSGIDDLISMLGLRRCDAWVAMVRRECLAKSDWSGQVIRRSTYSALRSWELMQYSGEHHETRPLAWRIYARLRNENRSGEVEVEAAAIYIWSSLMQDVEVWYTPFPTLVSQWTLTISSIIHDRIVYDQWSSPSQWAA